MNIASSIVLVLAGIVIYIIGVAGWDYTRDQRSDHANRRMPAALRDYEHTNILSYRHTVIP
jgi:hypothetical protein